MTSILIRGLIKSKVCIPTIRAMSSTYLVDDPKFSFLKDLGIERVNHGVFNGKWGGSGSIVKSIDPASGNVIAEVKTGTPEELEQCIQVGVDAYKQWSNMPAPYRGEIIRQIGEEFRKYLNPLGINP